ncbi:MAG: hypothetical protein AB7O66_12985 [Limisphaerales bacterium]
MQKPIRILYLTTVLTAGESLAATSPWINEFHYDDAGGDTGEFVEIAVPSSFADLASVTLTLYNGSDGRGYSTHSLDSFSQGSQEGGLSFYSKLIGGIQNGAPDGMALSWTDGAHFISYEGSFTAANGPAAGLTSFDIGIAQPDTGAPDGSSLGLIGFGGSHDDFVWASIDTATPGGVNLGQTVVPEPQAYVILTAGGLGLAAFLRSRRRPPAAA